MSLSQSCEWLVSLPSITVIKPLFKDFPLNTVQNWFLGSVYCLKEKIHPIFVLFLWGSFS